MKRFSINNVDLAHHVSNESMDVEVIQLEEGEVVLNRAEREFIYKELKDNWTDHENYAVGKKLFKKLRGEE